MALIHVVIPVYNAERYLRDTVESVLSQPAEEIDVVLVNDGSSDGSAALCDGLAAKDDRIHVIHQKNAGVSAARNAGIRYFQEHDPSDDGFLIFLDSDDIWAPGIFTPEFCSRIRQETDTDVFVFGSCTANGDVTKFSDPRRYEDIRQAGGNGCIWKTQGTFCANLYRTSLFRRWGIRFIDGLKYSEDKIFMLQCVFLARYVRFLPPVLHVYRNNSSSAMKQVFSIDPIDYYVPIINGWLQSDAFLNALSDQTNRVCEGGQALAAIYLVEMVAEQMKRWRSYAQVMEVFRNHPHYPAAESGEIVRPNRREYPVNRLLFENPLRFRIKYRLRGCVEWVFRLLLQIPPVAKLRDDRRYPHTELPK